MVSKAPVKRPVAKKGIKAKHAGKKTTTPNSQIKKLFIDAGFEYIHSDNVHFEINTRTGEIDHVFYYENLLILVEETTSMSDLSGHFVKKRMFHEVLESNRKDFYDTFQSKNPAFKQYISKSGYKNTELEIRQIYFSQQKDLDISLVTNRGPLKILSIAEFKYFKTLSKTIGHSAKFEVLKYLGVQLSNLGSRRISGRGGCSWDRFDAFVLSDSQTNYPSGFGVVSFYADPAALIRRAYVLRRDGWEQPNISYQRFLKTKKLQEMRRHLANDNKVYINNLIVTLPANAEIYDAQNNRIPLNDISQIHTGQIALPDELGTVGIVDGQHRIFSYHEGKDEYDPKIDILRKRQNLLVTGIIFPKTYNPIQKVQFEAQLFMKINDTQTKVRSDLRQEIETIVQPFSPIAISKSVMDMLSKSGPLANLLQQSLYDTSEKIRTSSIVRYVLNPLTKTSGDDSLHALWVSEAHPPQINSAELLTQYVEYCTKKINEMLIGAKKNTLEIWFVKTSKGNGILSPTTVGGFLVCLRVLIKDKKLQGIDYEKQFVGLDTFEFAAFRSSRWSELGHQLADTFFTKNK